MRKIKCTERKLVIIETTIEKETIEDFSTIQNGKRKSLKWWLKVLKNLFTMVITMIENYPDLAVAIPSALAVAFGASG